MKTEESSQEKEFKERGERLAKTMHYIFTESRRAGLYRTGTNLGERERKRAGWSSY